MVGLKIREAGRRGLDNEYVKNVLAEGILLGLIFVIMKALAVEPVAAWSWWWVTAPFWFGFALAIVIAIVASLRVGTFSLFDGVAGHNKWKDM